MMNSNRKNANSKGTYKRRSEMFFTEEELEEAGISYSENRHMPEDLRGRFKDASLKKRSSWKKKALIAGVIIAAILAAFIIIRSNRNEIVKSALKSDIAASVAHEVIGDSYDKNVLDKNFDRSKIAVNPGVSIPDGYRSFAVFGIDARDSKLSEGSRSDTMMVISVNEETQDIKMASVFRDTYLVDDCNADNEYYIGKANAAYAIGGPELALSMLNRNWDLALTDYAVVNFAGLSNIIDAMGGLTLEVTDDEIKEINYHMKGQIDVFGGEYVKLTKAGTVRMNGAQATTFCRVRSVPFNNPHDGQVYEADYGRTARQRYAMFELFKQAKQAGMSTLIKIINEICDNNTGKNHFITTSIPLSEFMKIMSGFSDMEITGQDGFPHTDKEYITMLDSGSTIVADTLEENMLLMHEFLYGEKDHIPSDDFKKYESWITAWVNVQKTGDPNIMYDPDSPVQETAAAEEFNEEYYEEIPYTYIPVEEYNQVQESAEAENSYEGGFEENYDLSEEEPESAAEGTEYGEGSETSIEETMLPEVTEEAADQTVDDAGSQAENGENVISSYEGDVSEGSDNEVGQEPEQAEPQGQEYQEEQQDEPADS